MPRNFIKLLIIPILLFVVSTAFLNPDVASAQGFVPCDGPDCNFCHFVTLANTVIAWLIGVLAVVFGVMIFAAGIGLVTSGGNPGKLDEAKKSLTNALIGLIIVLAAYLIVDTLLKATLPSGSIPKFGPWNEVKCTPSQLVGGEYTPEDYGTGVSGDGSCSITPLTPLTDPQALQMENGVKVLYNGNTEMQKCALKLVSAIGGTITSAYRPVSYQNHFYEIFTKWCTQNLRNNTDSDCATVKSQVGAELSKHSLSCANGVAASSDHSTGNAIDISPGGVPAPVNTCFTWIGNIDKVHYVYKSGCICN